MQSFPERSLLYPLLFKPIYKTVMWGGRAIADHFNRDIPESAFPVGEAAEIVDRPDAASVVSNGSLAGVNLTELVNHYRRDLIGNSDEGGPFPLLIKIIDAAERLSLQVHPDTVACERIGNGAEPKTEMWVVLDARPGAEILAGIARNSAQHIFMEAVEKGNLENCIQSYPSVSGDAYFIRAGRVHAIGGGNLIYEVQQNSDTTYRVSDWGRVDRNGKPRELHIDQSLKCIDFTDRNTPRIPGVSNITAHNRKVQLVGNCPFFTVDSLKLVDHWNDNTHNISFHILMPVDGEIKVGNERFTTIVPRGASCLIPACFGPYEITVTAPTSVIRTTR